MYKLHITCLLFPFRFSKLDMWSQRVCRSESSPHQSQLSCSQLESGAHQRGQGRCRAGTDLVKCHRGEQRQMKEPFCPLMQQIVGRHCQETQTVRPPRSHCTHVPQIALFLLFKSSKGCSLWEYCIQQV